MSEILKTLRVILGAILLGVLIGTGIKITDWVWQKPRLIIELSCDDTSMGSFAREKRELEM